MIARRQVSVLLVKHFAQRDQKVAELCFHLHLRHPPLWVLKDFEPQLPAWAATAPKTKASEATVGKKAATVVQGRINKPPTAFLFFLWL